MIPVLTIEQRMEQRYAKFQAGGRMPAGFKFNEPTRLYLELTDSGQFKEYDPASGECVGSGVIEMPEKEVPTRSAA